MDLTSCPYFHTLILQQPLIIVLGAEYTKSETVWSLTSRSDEQIKRFVTPRWHGEGT